MDSKAPPPGSTTIHVVIDDSLWKGMEAFHANSASSAPSQPLKVVVMPMTKMQDVREEVVNRIKEVVTPNQFQAIVRNSGQGEQGEQGEHGAMDSAMFALMCKDKVVDLVLPFRLTNLPQPVKLRLVSQQAASFVASMAGASHKKFKPSATATHHTAPSSSLTSVASAKANVNVAASTPMAQPPAKPSAPASSNLVSVAVYLVEADGGSKRTVARVDPQASTIKALAEKVGFDTTTGQLSACVVKVDEKLIGSTNHETSLAELGYRTGSVQVKIYLVANMQGAELPVPSTEDRAVEAKATAVATSVNIESIPFARTQGPTSTTSMPSEQPKEIFVSAESSTVADKLTASHVFHASRVRIIPPPSENASGAPSYADEDDSFYELRQGELLAIMKQSKAEKEHAILMTSAMRAKKEHSSRPKYESAKIRIRFQDRVCIQAEFPANASIGNLYDLVASCLSDEGKTSIKSYYLYVSPPVTKFLDRNQTLEKEHLVPSAIVLLGIEPHMLVSERPEFSCTWALRKELLDEAYRDEEVRKAHWEKQQANQRAEREAEEATSGMQIDSASTAAADAAAVWHDDSIDSKLTGKNPQKATPKWFKKQ